jgi:hypothetical protein
MKKLVITFGLISAAIIAVLMSISMSFMKSNGFEGGEIYGYLSMIIAFSTIFVAVKSYRDNHLKGSITFGKGFKVGLYITLITSVLYVVWWMIYSNTVYTTFTEDFVTFQIQKLQESGASAEEIEAMKEEMKSFAELYANPFFKVGMTFLEIFPVGLIVSLISAALLRRREILPA